MITLNWVAWFIGWVVLICGGVFATSEIIWWCLCKFMDRCWYWTNFYKAIRYAVRCMACEKWMKKADDYAEEVRKARDETT